VLWRRSDYESLGGWDEALVANQDGDLMMRALLHGLEFEVADSGEALYRTHGDLRLTVSSTRVLTLEKFRSHVRVLDKVAAQLKARGLLARYAEPLGLEYHRLAVLGFQQGYIPIARTCLQRGVDHAGLHSVSRTWAGRLVARLVGVEAKEQLLSWLAARGVATGARRRHLSFRARWKTAVSEKAGGADGD
jgi:hypothetical protein